MSNETIVISQEQLFLTWSGRRVTALPDTGTIASMTKTAPDAEVIGGLHQIAVFVINGSDVHDVVINVMPYSIDHSRFDASRQLTRKSGIIHSLAITYKTSNWVSNAIVIASIGTQTFNADGADVIPINLRGKFQIATVGSFVNLPTATPAQIDALIP